MGKKSDESGRERGKVSILGVVALWGDFWDIPTGIYTPVRNVCPGWPVCEVKCLCYRGWQ